MVGSVACVLMPAIAQATSVYVTNAGLPGAVSQFTVEPLTGALTSNAPAQVAAGSTPSHIAVSADGKSVYVTNQNSNTVGQYDVNPATGALTPKTPAEVGTGEYPRGVAVSPDGKSVYVTAGESVMQFDVNQTTGALTSKTPAEVATGANVQAVAVSPDSKSVYVTAVESFKRAPGQHRLAIRRKPDDRGIDT